MVHKLSIVEYHRLCEREPRFVHTELVRGVVIEKISKTPMHSSVASLLERIISAQVRPDFCVRKDGALTLRDSEPEPDISIVSGRHEDYLRSHPSTAALVVEVAVTSPNDDRALAEIYAEAGVGEYWVVLPKERAIEVFRQPEGLAYREVRRHEFADELTCSTVPGVKFALSELFAGIAPAGA